MESSKVAILINGQMKEGKIIWFAPPKRIADNFATKENGEIWQDMVAASESYAYDIGEKDKSYFLEKGGIAVSQSENGFARQNAAW